MLMDTLGPQMSALITQMSLFSSVLINMVHCNIITSNENSGNELCSCCTIKTIYNNTSIIICEVYCPPRPDGLTCVAPLVK